MEESYNLENIREYLESEIVSCYNCQPYSRGHPYWLGEHTDIADLLIDYDLNEEQKEEIIENLNCPNCGTDLSFIYSEVQLKSEHDKKVDEIFESLEDSKILKKLDSLEKQLHKFPYLGYLDSTAEELSSIIKDGKDAYLYSKFWFRARRLNNESRIYTTDEMKAPNPENVYVKEGRYNHTGQSFLYLAEDEETAFLEIRKMKENVCIIQKYEKGEISNILDLRSNYENVDPDIDLLYWAFIYNGNISGSTSKSSWKPEYLLPRFIADLARYHGYNGIAYTSTILQKANFVIFNSKDINIQPIDMPYIYKYVPDTKRPF